MSWLGGAVQRWIALVSLGATILGVVTFAVTEHLPWAWLAIGSLALLVLSAGWTVRDEHQRRIAAEDAPHQPPGDGIPLHAPVDYQVAALRQAIPRLAETMEDFGEWELEEVLKNLPRRHVDPIYEPLRSCGEGLARLAELGEIEAAEHGWSIAKSE